MRLKALIVAVAAAVAVALAGCTEEAPAPSPTVAPATATPDMATATPAPASTPAPTPTAIPGLPPPPALLGLDPFYQKYVDAGGIPVVSSAKAPDEALLRVAAMIDELLAERPDLRAAIVASGGRIAVRAPTEPVNELPEYRHLGIPTFWGDFGAHAGIPVSTAGANNVLCEPDVHHGMSGDVFVHEFAHMVQSLGMPEIKDGLRWSLKVGELFADASQEGLWEGTYAAANVFEYWAVTVQAWFDVGLRTGGVDTRAELEAYDPRIAALIHEVFGDVSLDSSCHKGAYPETPPAKPDPALRRFSVKGVVTGPDGESRRSMGVWLCQDGVRTFKYSGVGGNFEFRVRPGSMTLAVYKGRTVLGWYGGENGFTTDRSEATEIVVGDSDVTGIAIELPAGASGVEPVGECPAP